MRKAKGQAGFTLIEITAVVILVALIASTAIVRLDGVLPSTRVESVGRGILATMDLARTQAIARARPYEVILDFEEQRYGIRVPFDDEGMLIANEEDRPMLSWTSLQDGALLLGVLDPRGQTISDGIYPVEFDAQGASSDLHLYLGLEDMKDFELTLRVLALTGIASVYQGHIEPQLLMENDF
ncbi:MAG: pilus assembly FimT family protein [Planctomycetota bacterium]